MKILPLLFFISFPPSINSFPLIDKCLIPFSSSIGINCMIRQVCPKQYERIVPLASMAIGLFSFPVFSFQTLAFNTGLWAPLLMEKAFNKAEEVIDQVSNYICGIDPDKENLKNRRFRDHLRDVP